MIMDIYIIAKGDKDLSDYGIEKDDVFGVEINCQEILIKPRESVLVSIFGKSLFFQIEFG